MGGKDSLIGRLLGNTQQFSPDQIEQTMRLLVEHGLARGASDIHIEPHDQFVLVRYRIDGNLRGIHKLPRLALEPLLLHIKEAANIPAAHYATPQEGQYEARVGDQDVRVRVSTLPVIGGEKAVLRVIVQGDPTRPLEDLGLWGNSLRAVQNTLAQPHGLVVVAGSKRSGTTTTLYSLLSLVSTPHINTSTVEDHIEHRLPGVNQTHLHAQSGISFAEGLQAVLRQDANVILLSNIPDRPTAELAVHAATTGHFVLAGLHADSSATAVLQLCTTGTQPFLLATALRLVIAQKLVRKLCEHCRKHHTVSAQERAALEETFDIANASGRRFVHELEQLAVQEDLGRNTPLSTTAGRITHIWRANPEGCAECGHTGYRGRTGLIEALSLSEPLRSLLLGSTTVTSIENTAAKEGFVPIHIDGLVKALRGITSAEEVLRVLPHAA